MTGLAVFDWNSTLIDDIDACVEAKNAALAFLGHPPITRRRLQEIFTFPILHAYVQAGVDPDHYLAHAEEVGDIYVSTYKQAAESCTLRRHTIDVLEWLQARDIPAIILSNHLQSHLTPHVESMGIAHYFETISGTKDYATILHKMNKQERLENYLNENAYQPEKSFIIGDSHEEPELARHLGLTGISITGGLLTPGRIAACAPDHVIDDMHELLPVMERLFNDDAPLAKGGL